MDNPYVPTCETPDCARRRAKRERHCDRCKKLGADGEALFDTDDIDDLEARGFVVKAVNEASGVWPVGWYLVTLKGLEELARLRSLNGGDTGEADNG